MIIFHVPGQVSMLCHAQMPLRDPYKNKCYDSCPHPCFNELPKAMDNKYVKCSVEFMVRQLKEGNNDLRRPNTTIIGGASVIPEKSRADSIGENNVKMVKCILKDSRIMINREITGGEEEYTPWYHTDSDRLYYERHQSRIRMELENNKF